MIASESIETTIESLGIEEVLHFTTNSGLLGILATGYVKSRALVDEDEYLESIFTANANVRKDRNWLRHVNLSIGRVNPTFFEISQGWHRWEEVWWCVLAFDPVMLTHEHVTFATTNNIYSRVRRGQGVAGLKALYAPVVERYYGRTPAARSTEHRDCWPTCEQAEVLYPEQLSTQYLRRVYFATAKQLQTARAQIVTLGHAEVDLVLAPEMFRRDG